MRRFTVHIELQRKKETKAKKSEKVDKAVVLLLRGAVPPHAAPNLVKEEQR